MKVFDLMMQLARHNPYAEIGGLWDGGVADIDAVLVDSKGLVILDCSVYASCNIRLAGEMA